MKHLRQTLILSLILAMIAAVASGCSKPRRELAPLTGKVTFEGKPLQFGSVTMEHSSGQPATAAIQSDGTFAMATIGEGEGAAVGKWRVRIGCNEAQDPAKRPAPGQPAIPGKSLIPERYASFDLSGLVVDVRPGRNEPIVLSLTK